MKSKSKTNKQTNGTSLGVRTALGEYKFSTFKKLMTLLSLDAFLFNSQF